MSERDDECPNGCNLVGGEIPDEFRHMYGRGATHYRRTIGIYDLAADRTVEWECPDCRVRWPR